MAGFFNDLLHVEDMPVILSMLKHGSWNYGTMFFCEHFWCDFQVAFVLHFFSSPPWELGVKMWQVYHAYDGRGRQSLVSDYHRFAKNGSILQVKNGGEFKRNCGLRWLKDTKRVSLESLKEATRMHVTETDVIIFIDLHSWFMRHHSWYAATIAESECDKHIWSYIYNIYVTSCDVHAMIIQDYKEIPGSFLAPLLILGNEARAMLILM